VYCTRCCGEALYNHGASWISYAKWCDLMVNHDADRRLCQYLIKTVFWWHFPFIFYLWVFRSCIFMELWVLKWRCPVCYANWCDRMVNHDAGRGLCQYLIKPVCWWHLVVSIKPWIFVELALLKYRWPQNLLAKWCDLLVNHDADRRLCQYLRKSVCWWHFPVLYQPLKLVWFGFLHVRFVGCSMGKVSVLAVHNN